ncbi:OmpA-like domain-containing protein [Tenacibaculum sp. 190130A14a]|uniref:OmpA-like domain-containing protein n=1 Tax=Tenacibaculum polynesiense TaxID=3137857 RepID=A0ABM9PG47_9FLAO
MIRFIPLQILICVLFTATTFGQRKYAADRYFNEFAYKKSAELYKVIYDKGDDSYLVLSRLGDSHYFNFEFDLAEKYYKNLMSSYMSVASPKHVFRYAQVLKSNGKIKESDKWLLKLKDLGEDSRAEALENNMDYFVEYSNKPKTYINIHNIASNTKYSDFGGFLYDNNLYFASAKPKSDKDKKLYRWNRQPFINIYKTEKKEIKEDKVLDVEDANLIEELSSKYHESNLVITKDGNTAYFTRDNFDGKRLRGDKDRVSHLKIYKVQKIGDYWGDIVELPFNSEDYSCGHPALSPDEKTLYFVSDMGNGLGATDIYKVSILENNSFGEPINLGKNVNTEGREMFPFIKNDGTLFFASDGHLGLGGLDIFESKFENQKYTAPINVGTPVNGPFDDFAFVINNDDTHGFFSSNRKGGVGDDDIYSFTIYNCKEDITGIVSDSRTGAPISEVLVQLMNEKGEPIEEQQTDTSGAYVFKKIDCEKNFVVVVSKENYRNKTKDTQTLDVNKQTIVENIQLESLIVENQIVINPIYFDFDLYNIREDAEYELEHIVSVLNNNPDLVIKIESHTDSRGTKEYNRNLSSNRAKSTRDYIISRGILPERIESAIGYGEDKLLNDCNDTNQSKCTEEEHQKNRRSYFYIVKGGASIQVNN